MCGCPDRQNARAYIGRPPKPRRLSALPVERPDRKISQFFSDFFGLKFVPASAYGFERQAVRRGLPLTKILRRRSRPVGCALPMKPSWRHDGKPYWRGCRQSRFGFLPPGSAPLHRGRTSCFGERFPGTLVCDAYASYNAFIQDRQSCLAHIKTKAKELEQELALLKRQGG